MRLLILTQKVNIDDPILGFFHRWIIEFAKHFESIVVICLEKGKYDLPDNVKVLSLGKEENKSRAKYLYKFYKYIWQERGNYDAVFVHMNQEYVILGGILWKILGKKIYMWRNHAKGNIFTILAAYISEKMFYTSNQSFIAKYKKAVDMPVGVIIPDNIEVKKVPRSILFLGRISPVKNVKLFVESLLLLDEKGVDFTSIIEGDPVNKEDFQYLEEVKNIGKILMMKNKLKFKSGKPIEDSIISFASAHIYVNLTPGGSLDKSIFGAMACKTIVLVANKYFENILSSVFVLDNLTPDLIARHIRIIFNMQEQDISLVRRNSLDYVKYNHSIELTITRLVNGMN